MLQAEQLSRRIIGLAIEVHRDTGRGLLEPVYEQCLCRALRAVEKNLLPTDTVPGVPPNRRSPWPVSSAANRAVRGRGSARNTVR